MSSSKTLQSLVILGFLGAFAAPANAQFFFEPPPETEAKPAPRATQKPRPQPRQVRRDDDDDLGVVDLQGSSLYREPGVAQPRVYRDRDYYRDRDIYRDRDLDLPRGARGGDDDGAGAGANYAALPPDADPNYSTPVDLDNKVNFKLTTQKMVPDPTGEAAGTVTINTRQRKLYYSLGDGQAVSYSIAVGKAGFAWKGQATIGRKAFWPGWTPPKEMLERRPDLPEHMDGALNNPLGARALYLFQGKTDTLFRIHGTNEPKSIGTASSSGCIRMHNADVIDLYGRVAAGTKVVVM
ncbi:lipoprotein-anchoring transpeptidase ErfK/SrfK [Rhodoblastus acidophilus]|uniref:L,D-transpeptidase n=1 Tax=Rhodoblastus acidophilus TaxID=1074 RepID=UPI0029CAB644|nr:L,D-transpeptidase [Rhodoblastus acidophilus]MCW2284809.1 lipoprotein-anchoring transpeptidase ErfK/SrfK [Rhodoblastus acidophilus]MCW2333762.1 lipoprotein-anchoring transpeptidase ErfK/SrfK [Rhodoblastus acidophilus]